MPTTADILVDTLIAWEVEVVFGLPGDGIACRSALSKRGVAHLSIANDVQEQSLEDAPRSKRNQPKHVPNQWFEGRRLPR
jgi:thiamine pyrophosphate-dependent acetolactate synthase large subunit-like protein